MTDQQITLREFFEERFKRLEEQNQQAIELGKTQIEKQDVTNGRVRAAEKSIAVLTWAYGLGVAVIGWIVYRVLP